MQQVFTGSMCGDGRAGETWVPSRGPGKDWLWWHGELFFCHFGKKEMYVAVDHSVEGGQEYSCLVASVLP